MLNRTNMASYREALGVTWSPQRFTDDWERFENLIIREDGADVGTLRLLEVDGGLEVRDLQVLPARQGLGIGAWALAEAKAFAATRGLEQLKLRVFVDNPARNLYSRSGFRVVKEEGGVMHMSCHLPLQAPRLARIAVPAEPYPRPKTLALFDFDGTITTGESMPVFVRRSTTRARLLLGQVLLAPMVVGYKLGLVQGVLIRRVIVRMAYARLPAAQLQAAGVTFAQDYLTTVLRPEAMQRIAWHKAQGHGVAVVSGGLDVYLAPWCRAHGVELICSSLQHQDGLLTGRYEGEQCVLQEKARRVRERYDLGAYAQVYAYGDTHEDQGLLDLATCRYYRGQEVEASMPLRG